MLIGSIKIQIVTSWVEGSDTRNLQTFGEVRMAWGSSQYSSVKFDFCDENDDRLAKVWENRSLRYNGRLSATRERLTFNSSMQELKSTGTNLTRSTLDCVPIKSRSSGFDVTKHFYPQPETEGPEPHDSNGMHYHHPAVALLNQGFHIYSRLIPLNPTLSMSQQGLRGRIIWTIAFCTSISTSKAW